MAAVKKLAGGGGFRVHYHDQDHYLLAFLGKFTLTILDEDENRKNLLSTAAGIERKISSTRSTSCVNK